MINRCTNFCDRNLAELLSVIVSNFTSNYVFNWKRYFGIDELQNAPTFRASTLLIPNEENLVTYLLTKQHECYIKNLNNTLYCALVGEYRRYSLDAMSCDPDSTLDKRDDLTYKIEETVQRKKCVSDVEAVRLIQNEINSISKINEYLFKEFGINYNNELELFRKGTLTHLNRSGEVRCFNGKLNDEFLLSVLSGGKENDEVNPHIDHVNSRSNEDSNQINQSNQSFKKLKTSEPVDAKNKMIN